MDKTILVVDDDSDFMALIEHDLKKSGFYMIAAYDGEQGVRKLKESRPDIVLLDIKMPKSTPETVVEQFKQADPSVPIVIYSNYVQSEKLRQHLTAQGVRKIIPKTVSREALIKDLESIL